MHLKKIFVCFLISYFVFICSVSQAQGVPNVQAQEGAFKEWKETFYKQALEAGISETFLKEVLPQITLLQHVLDADQKQPEFQLTFWTYTDKTLSDARIKKGKEMLETHKDILLEAEKKYNVPSKYIVAFWGLESNYGSHKGNIETLNALATLSYDPRRRTFFTKELIALLKIMEKEGVSDMKGSWAGAFGNFQFMPTTFRAYAVDGDGDGKIDVVNSIPDAIYSAAHYLSTMGWNPNIKWGREVKITKTLSWEDVHSGKPKTIKDWQKMGVMPANGSPWSTSTQDIVAEIAMPMGIYGPVFLTYSNFKVIMRWNRSQLYALAVGLLSDGFEQENLKIYAKRINNPLSKTQQMEIQELLIKGGYYEGEIDGNIGRGTRESIRQYQKDQKLPQDGYADKKLLNKLKGLN